MKKNKVALGLLLTSCFLISACKQVSAGDTPTGLEFRIGLQKDTFFVSEPIWLDIYMTNLAEEQVGIKPLTPASDWLKIVIVNSKNDTIPYKGETTEWIGGGPTFTVQPKETLYICRDLLEGTGFGALERWISGRTYLEPGIYSIKAIYKRQLESNQLTCAVVNPTEDEKTALELWREGYNRRAKKETDISIEKWKDLLGRYPNSVFAPSAARALAATYRVFIGDRENSQFYERKLLSDYPNSGFCQHAFGAFTIDKDPDEKEQILKELEAEHAGTRAGKFARNIRKKIYAY
jgi:hypothetical protein